MVEMNIDGKGMIAGRLAAYVAKQAMLGHTVNVYNCGDIVMTGSKAILLEKYHGMYARGRPTRGPYLHRAPDRFFRRIIRGMVPHKQPKGKNAFQRVMCYVHGPDEKAVLMKVEGRGIERLKMARFMYLRELCKLLGGNV